MTLREIARTWYRRPQDLPPTVDPRGLEATIGYKPMREPGTFSYAAHVAIVAVDPALGDVEILDYVIVEDAGKLINPMVADGQISAASRRGSARRSMGDALRQGRAAARLHLGRLHPAGRDGDAHASARPYGNAVPLTEFGVKGLGEGGAIAPPAAIGNAINDALKPLGAEVLHSPITPRRILDAIEKGRGAAGTAP